MHYKTSSTLKFIERLALIGYWELDLKTKQLFFSSAAYKILGISSDYIKSSALTIQNIIHPDDVILYQKKIRELLKCRKKVTAVIRIKIFDFPLKYYNFVADINFNKTSKKIIGIFQDITEIYQYLQKCQSENNQQKSYFLAQSLHDIKQPLQLLTMYIETLYDMPSSDTKDNILSLIKKLSTGFNNVFDIAKLESKGLSKTPVYFDIKQSINNILKEYKIYTDKKHLTIKSELKSFLLYQDKILSERIIQNIFGNAVKYAHSTIKIKNIRNEFWIIDDGKGIDFDKQKHIFEAFYQCNNLSDKHIGGSGIGLNTVALIAKFINAEIRFKSRPNLYTLFKITF